MPEVVKGGGGVSEPAAGDVGVYGSGFTPMIRLPRAVQTVNGRSQLPVSSDLRADQSGRTDLEVRAQASRPGTSAPISNSERDQIARALHDGAQQRLSALRLRLRLAGERAEALDDADASAVLNQFGEEVEQAIDELREFVRASIRPG